MSRTRTALVVDDEDALLRLMTRVLERAGLRVLGASNGAEARQLFAAHAREIEIVLLDVVMPDDDGAATLLPDLLAERPDLRVVLTSGDALPEPLESLLEGVGGRFLRKPFAPRALLSLFELEPVPARSAPIRAPGPPGPEGR